MNYKIHILIISLLLLCACSKEANDVLPETDYDGPSVHQSDFVPGDVATRSSFEFDGSSLLFSWVPSDAVGIYTTAAIPLSTRATDTQEGAVSEGSSSSDVIVDTNDGLIIPDSDDPTTIHPELQSIGLYYTDPKKQNQTKYVCTGTKEGAQTARIASQGGFDWDENSRWTAYFPLKNVQQKYNEINFDFSGQKQTGFVDMTYYYVNRTTNKPTYRAQEREACKHIANADVMISPETKFEYGKIRFEMRHIGAVARFFLIFPKEKQYKVKNLKLICESPIFYTAGKYSLKSRVYKSNATDGDFGLSLVAKNKVDSQVQPVGDKTKMLELDFDPEKVIVNNGGQYSYYLIAYLMMYPITYTQAEHGNLYAYVTAEDPDNPTQDIHFVTAPLADKDMVSGSYYQWLTAANPQDGLYPIELTATLLPWQDIVGSGIETDLEK